MDEIAADAPEERDAFVAIIQQDDRLF